MNTAPLLALVLVLIWPAMVTGCAAQDLYYGAMHERQLQCRHHANADERSRCVDVASQSWREYQLESTEANR